MKLQLFRGIYNLYFIFVFEGAPTLYFSHYLYAAIFFNIGLSKSAFSAYYFGNLLFVVLCFMCPLGVLSFQSDVIVIEHLYNHFLKSAIWPSIILF